MRYDLDGKNITIPDEFIEKTMRGLKLSKAEAIAMYLADEGLVENPDQAALNEKAKLAGPAHREKADKAARKPPVRKPDEEKREIVGFLFDILGDIEKGGTEAGFAPTDVNVTNIERMIAFAVGDNRYELTLTKKRPPKGE